MEVSHEEDGDANFALLNLNLNVLRLDYVFQPMDV